MASGNSTLCSKKSVADVEQGVARTAEAGPANNEQVFLLNSQQQAVAPKDFFVEIRGIMDVEHLLDHAIVLLDVFETDLDTIIHLLTDAIPVSRDIVMFTDVQNAVFSYSELNHTRVPSIRQKLQGVLVQSDNVIVDQSWLTIYCALENLEHRHICFARMNLPTNFGPGLGDVQFVLLVIAPQQEKDTKSAFETARTFSTLLTDPSLRQRLLDVNSNETFIREINFTVDRMAFQLPVELESKIERIVHKPEPYLPIKGIVTEFRHRLDCYVSDFTDGIADRRSVQKTISTAVFLYFSILPSVIALGMLNDQNTGGLINVRKEILAQWIGGLFFGAFGGQLFLIMLSTAPISIYIQVIHEIAVNNGFDFFRMFTTIGLWCSLWLVVFAVFEAPRIMKFARRSLEELFGLFISIALIYEAALALVHTFQRHDPACDGDSSAACDHSVSLLFLLLMLGTLWISMTLYRFRTTPFLTKTKRDLLADYALPLGVVIMALVGALGFTGVPTESFKYDPEASAITVVPFWELSSTEHAICFGLGLPLAVLFFMDQLIVTNTVDNSQNNLKKGASPNWDLLVVALMNVVLSVLGLPWMHGALPQAYLHLKAQADVEDRLVDGVVQQVVVKNRESRLATLLAHLMMVPTYFFLLPLLTVLPVAVFHGLFLFLAFTTMIGNEFCQRMALCFTEQRSYPPLHYIRRVPQKVVHVFTLVESLQLALLCFVGLCPWPVVNLAFPVVTFLFIPLRACVLPRIFNPAYLLALDPVH